MNMEGFPAEKTHRNSTEGLEMTGITKAFLQKFGKAKIQLGQKEQTHLQQDNDLKNGTHRVGCASSYFELQENEMEQDLSQVSVEAAPIPEPTSIIHV